MPRNRRPAVEVSYESLIITYALLVAYAVISAIVSLPSLETVLTRAVTIGTLAAVAVLGLLCITAVIHTMRTGHGRFEIIVSYVFFVFFLTYPIVIVARTLEDGNVNRLPFMLLAVALAVTPYSRTLVLARQALKRGVRG